MHMGRKRKYITNEEKLTANREKFMRHYEKNKEKIRKKNLERYHAKKSKHG